MYLSDFMMYLEGLGCRRFGIPDLKNLLTTDLLILQCIGDVSNFYI